ncbi:MAG: hypothetical protein U0Q12_20065 [Vicinamibacterales bacterium]
MSLRRPALPIVLVLFTRLAAAQAALPPGWPSQLELGMADSPGGAAAMRQTAPFAFRYQYLAGGVNTGTGWSTWNPNGDFARFYIEDSIAHGITPVFTYYMLLQSSPGGGSESDADLANLNNVTTMTAYFNDLTLFFQKAGAFPAQRVVLHVEPDFWGYMEQRAPNDDARAVPAKVSETGLARLAGLPSTVAGFAQAVVRLRDALAPNVTLAYHISVWGTNVDIALQDPSDAVVDTLAARAAAFYRSLGANFDIAFAEFSDRDSGFYQFIYGDQGRSWWTADDFRRNVRFLGGFSSAAGKRIVMWQIPFGNTKMRAMNNTWGHYQDNRPEWLLDDLSRAHLTAYRDAGVVAFLFGGGADGTTCACGRLSDGVTNPAPIGTNTIASELAPAGTPPALAVRGTTSTLVTPYAADDDGGFFRWRAWQYYQTGAMPLGTVVAQPPTAPRNVRVVPGSN